MIFDTHAHFDDHAFDADQAEVIGRLKDGGIGKICNIGANIYSSRTTLELAHKYDFFYAAVGTHPDDCLQMEDWWIDEYREMAKDPKVAAIGEIGLDYHGFDTYENKPSKELQQKWFLEQLELARELNKTVVIHSRNAAADTLEILQDAYQKGTRKAIVHCFSYSQETAKEYIKMGFYLGFGGVITYEGQRKLTKVLQACPIEQIVLETDCPYLAPAPYRYERNSSLYLPIIRDKLAELKGLTPEEVERITWENGHKIYGIEE